MNKLTYNETTCLELLIKYVKGEIELSSFYFKRTDKSKVKELCDKIIKKSKEILEFGYKSSKDTKELQVLFYDYKNYMEEFNYNFTPSFNQLILDSYIQNKLPY